MRIYIRKARPADRDAVLKFTEHTWEWGDYIADVWERWLTETGSRLIVATLNRTPVGLCHTVMVSETECWLEGMRVNTDFRRQNIAIKLTERSIVVGVSLGADVLRFITSSENTPVHKLAVALVFRKTVVIQPMHAVPLTELGPTIIRPRPEDITQVVSFIEKSASYKAMGGLYSKGWRFLKLTPDEIKERLDEGNLRIIAKDGHIESVAIIETRWDLKALGVSYAGGEVEPMSRLAVGLRSEAVSLSLEEVNTRLPDMPEIAQAFINAGYLKSDEPPFWIFEKKLTV